MRRSPRPRARLPSSHARNPPTPLPPRRCAPRACRARVSCDRRHGLPTQAVPRFEAVRSAILLTADACDIIRGYITVYSIFVLHIVSSSKSLHATIVHVYPTRAMQVPPSLDTVLFVSSRCHTVSMHEFSQHCPPLPIIPRNRSRCFIAVLSLFYRCCS
eukprot:IDg18445t1